MDHPRSRGVYPGWVPIITKDPGSSPLARGLRAGDRNRHLPGGIIPARAGFTWASLPRTRPRRDHPRSRGVYCAARRSPRTPVGSSPLARGLPCVSDEDGDAARIIPARAGFTTLPGPRRSSQRDHPRSRGVYPPSGTTSPSTWGSSPLARGLQKRGTVIMNPTGIIPARAGFTQELGHYLCPG